MTFPLVWTDAVGTYGPPDFHIENVYLPPGDNPVRAIHLNELQQYMDELRSLLSRTPWTWVNFPVVDGVGNAIRAVQMNELRDCFDDIIYPGYKANFSNETGFKYAPNLRVTALTHRIRWNHLNELRDFISSFHAIGTYQKINDYVDPFPPFTDLHPHIYSLEGSSIVPSATIKVVVWFYVDWYDFIFPNPQFSFRSSNTAVLPDIIGIVPTPHINPTSVPGVYSFEFNFPEYHFGSTIGVAAHYTVSVDNYPCIDAADSLSVTVNPDVSILGLTLSKNYLLIDTDDLNDRTVTLSATIDVPAGVGGIDVPVESSKLLTSSFVEFRSTGSHNIHIAEGDTVGYLILEALYENTDESFHVTPGGTPVSDPVTSMIALKVLSVEAYDEDGGPGDTLIEWGHSSVHLKANLNRSVVAGDPSVFGWPTTPGTDYSLSCALNVGTLVFNVETSRPAYGSLPTTFQGWAKTQYNALPIASNEWQLAATQIPPVLPIGEGALSCDTTSASGTNYFMIPQPRNNYMVAYFVGSMHPTPNNFYCPLCYAGNLDTYPSYVDEAARRAAWDVSQIKALNPTFVGEADSYTGFEYGCDVKNNYWRDGYPMPDYVSYKRFKITGPGGAYCYFIIGITGLVTNHADPAWKNGNIWMGANYGDIADPGPGNYESYPIEETSILVCRKHAIAAWDLPAGYGMIPVYYSDPDLWAVSKQTTSWITTFVSTSELESHHPYSEGNFKWFIQSGTQDRYNLGYTLSLWFLGGLGNGGHGRNTESLFGYSGTNCNEYGFLAGVCGDGSSAIIPVTWVPRYEKAAFISVSWGFMPIFSGLWNVAAPPAPGDDGSRKEAFARFCTTVCYSGYADNSGRIGTHSITMHNEQALYTALMYPSGRRATMSVLLKILINSASRPGTVSTYWGI